MSILSVAEATTTLLDHLQPLATQRLPLRELCGCVLAEPVVMERDQPPFDRVTMDGIGLHSSGIAQTRHLQIAGTQAAGAAPLTLPGAHHCIEVMTGAQLPQGCDCVIPVERLKIEAGVAQVDDSLTLMPWLNVHRRGSDARSGDVLLQPGTRITAIETAIIASAGYAHAQVRRSPRIALVSTGDELIEPGQPIEDWQVRRSNTYALRAALQQHGHAQVTDQHLPDTLDTLRSHLRATLEQHDVLILSGGVSMGKFDFVPQVLTELGVRCVFHKIAQRPGKPMWFGVREDGKAVYALPGNPVSTLMCLYRYVLPGLARAMGEPNAAPAAERIALNSAAKTHSELTVFLPVKLLTDAAGTTRVEPAPTRGSGDFISLLGTHGFVELPAAATLINAGAVVRLFRW